MQLIVLRSERVAQSQNHRAAGLGLPGRVSVAEWQSLIRANDAKCTYCGEHAAVMDHIIPLSRGGSHSLDNITTACQSCDRKKGNLTPDERRKKALAVTRLAYPPVPTDELLTLDAMLAFIREWQGETTQQQFADYLSVSVSVLSDVLHKRRDPPPKLLQAMGFERVVVYRPKVKKAAKQ